MKPNDWNSRRLPGVVAPLLLLCVFAGCSHDTHVASLLPLTRSAGTATAARSVKATPADPQLKLAPGFAAEVIANVPGARELVVAVNGDLLVGTLASRIAIVPNADSATDPGPATTFATLPEGPAAGIVLGHGATLYVGTEHAVWKLAYTPGDRTASNPQKIAALRTGPVAPGTDGDIHHTTSVAVAGDTLYAGVGSSCDACTEADRGRAAIIRMGLNGEHPSVYARNVRNAIAMTAAPLTAFLWAGGAGQDTLRVGHPYEYFDSITQHPAGSNWGWPACEENNVAYRPGADCRAVVLPHVVLPAYSTIVGATFYPWWVTGPYVFPARFRNGLFLSVHGSWHTDASGAARVGPQVVFVPMNPNGWDARVPVHWNDPTAQYSVFFGGFQTPGTANFIGRTTGVRYGPGGSLFVADDKTGNIYRIRPIASAATAQRR